MTVLASSSSVTFYIRDSLPATTTTSSPSAPSTGQSIDLAEAKRSIENGDDTKRISSMQTILTAMVNGDLEVHSLLMHIIRFIVPSKNKTLKKLLLLYLENVNKLDSDGKLRQEMILVCNALRNDLQSPNEYVRGVTLRFLCKVKEVELLEPLAASVRACLDHKHPYVRRNAILAVNSIYKSVDFLIPDAPELIFDKFLCAKGPSGETDALCIRNAMAMLSACDPDRLSRFLVDQAATTGSFDPEVQLVVIEHVRRLMADVPESFDIHRQLLSSANAAVKYEAAKAMLVALRSDQTLERSRAVQDVLHALVSLIAGHDCDDNCRLIVLQTVKERLQEDFPEVLEDDAALLDILRALSSSDLHVKQLALNVVLTSVSGPRGNEVLSQLKRELFKLPPADSSQNDYRELLLVNIKLLASRLPELSSSVLAVFLEYLTCGCEHYTDQVTQFVKYTVCVCILCNRNRDLMERSPKLRSEALTRILKMLTGHSASAADKAVEARRVIGSLWIAGEFAQTLDEVESVFSSFEQGVGSVSLLQQELLQAQQTPQEAPTQTTQPPETKSKVRVLADGTYATETAISSATGKPRADQSEEPVIKSLLKKGFFEVGAVLCITVAKIVCQQEESSHSAQASNKLRARAMLLMTSIIRYGLSRLPEKPIDRESYDRILFTLRSLNSPTTVSELRAMFLACQRAFAAQQQDSSITFLPPSPSNSSSSIREHGQSVAVDSSLSFSVLPNATNLARHGAGGTQSDLEAAISGSYSSSVSAMNLLSRVVQLTGFSDAIYAETYVSMHQSDIFLDILLVNQLEETLLDVSLDFVANGDLKIIESPPPYVFGPLSFITLKAVIKVCSTCNGSISGSITYGMGGDEHSIVLLPIFIDVIDFVHPEHISDSAFRSQWTLLEWENKINIDVCRRFKSCAELYSFLSSHMRLLRIGQSLGDSADYLAGNMFGKTIFGEEILVNVCLEKSDSKIAGHLRLRSRSQGVAVALGDRILNLLKPFKG